MGLYKINFNVQETQTSKYHMFIEADSEEEALDIFDNVDCDVIEQYSTFDRDNGDAEPDFTYVEDGYYADDYSESEYKPYLIYKPENEEEIEDEENE